MAIGYQRKILIILLVLGCGSVNAEPNDEALKRAQAMMRKLQQEKQTLADQLEALNKENAALKAATAKTEKELNASRKTSANTAQALQAAQLAQATKEQELTEALQNKQRETDTLTADLTRHREQLGVCVANNKKLYEVGRELLQRYQDKGVMDALLQREPITQLKRVQMETLAEDVSGKLESHVIPAAPAP